MGRIGNSWKLMKTSLWVLKQDKEILIFPILSVIISLLILISFFASFFFFLPIETLSQPWSWVILFFIYIILYFFVIFFNTAVIGCANIRLNGGDPTVRDGFRIAGSHIGKIFLWAIISATVGIILKTIQQKAGWAGKIISFVAGVTWTYATFFIIPVLIFEEKSVFKSIKRSAQIFKITWGETLLGSLGFGVIFFLLAMIGLLFIIAGGLIGTTGLLIGIITAFIYWVVIGAIAAATDGIFVAALYQYSTKGQLPSAYDESLIPKRINQNTYQNPPNY